MWLPTMKRVIRDLMTRLSPKRQRTPRETQERVDVVNRQYAAAVRLARKVGSTPEDLLDYRRADALLARRNGGG